MWAQEEADELFELHAEIGDRDDAVDAIVQALLEKNIHKCHQQVRLSGQPVLTAAGVTDRSKGWAWDL